jgi:hypothetical protein
MVCVIPLGQAPEAEMFTSYEEDEKRAEPAQSADADVRLSRGMSALVIIGLSALSWIALMSIVMAFCALL